MFWLTNVATSFYCFSEGDMQMAEGAQNFEIFYSSDLRVASMFTHPGRMTKK